MRLLLALCMALLLAACSGKPSEGDARGALESRIRSDIRDDADAKFQIESFQKTNAQEMEVAGVKMYRILFTATVAYPNGYQVACANGGGFNCMMSRMDRMGRVSPQKVRTRVRYTGEVGYQMMEKGWSVQSVQLTQQSVEEIPPTPEELKEGAEWQRRVIDQGFASCPRVKPESERAAILAQSGAVEPEINLVSLSASGTNWNSLAVDDTTLQQYLEAANQRNPIPYILYRVEPGVSAERLHKFKQITMWAGVCTAAKS